MATNTEKLLMKNEALKKIVEHNRDYLSCSITLPLGNKALKKVHTNQWLFTDLPAEFDLANWTLLATVLNANTNRFEGYVKNRWYVDGCNIKVKGNTGSMELSLNAFASSYNSYADSVKSMEKAYTDATTNKSTGSTKQNTTKKNTTKAVSTGKADIKNGWWGSWVTDLVSKVVRKEKNTVLARCKKIHEYFRWHTRWTKYNNMIYTGGSVKNLEKQWGRHKFNCGDGANYLSAFYSACGAKTGIYLTYDAAHYIVKVEIDGKVYWCDHSGGEGAYNTLRGWNSTWHGYRSGSHRGRYV